MDVPVFVRVFLRTSAVRMRQAEQLCYNLKEGLIQHRYFVEQQHAHSYESLGLFAILTPVQFAFHVPPAQIEQAWGNSKARRWQTAAVIYVFAISFRRQLLCKVVAPMSVPASSMFAAAMPVGAAALHLILWTRHKRNTVVSTNDLPVPAEAWTERTHSYYL